MMVTAILTTVGLSASVWIDSNRPDRGLSLILPVSVNLRRDSIIFGKTCFSEMDSVITLHFCYCQCPCVHLQNSYSFFFAVARHDE